MSVALRLPAGAPLVAPFERPVGELPILDRPLAQWQADACREAGLTLKDAESPDAAGPARLWFEADAVFTGPTLRALLKAARSGVVQAAVAPHTALFDFVAPFVHDAPGPMPLPLWAAPRPTTPVREDVGLATVCDENTLRPVRVAPYGPAPHLLRIPDVDRFGGVLRHWLHALNINQALLETERRRQGAIGPNSVIGARCELAPNGLVEASILGDDCVVEPQASVMNSYLGDGVRISGHAVIERCVIGSGCHTLIDTHLRRVVAHGGSTLSNVGLYDVLLGAEIFITTGVAFFGGRPGRLVTLDGVDTRRPVLGGAVGPRSTLGARALFDEGIAVPAGTVIVGRPDEAASGTTPEKLARAGMLQGGRSSI
jgi:carbonic anhydrase/acetyltransferase-like protein (isoleucine patch superfamily)